MRERTTDLPERIEDSVLGTLRFTTALDGTDEDETRLVLDGHHGGNVLTLLVMPSHNDDGRP